MWIGHFDGSCAFSGLCGGYLLSGSIFQNKVYLAVAFQVEGDVQRTVLVFRIQIRCYADIFDTFLVTGIEVAITTYTAIAEEVLVFQIGAITPTEYLEGNQVFLTGFQIGCQVEFSFQFAVFAIAHILAVYPQVHIGSN